MLGYKNRFLKAKNIKIIFFESRVQNDHNSSEITFLTPSKFAIGKLVKLRNFPKLSL